jgi:hypothetical protein
MILKHCIDCGKEFYCAGLCEKDYKKDICHCIKHSQVTYLLPSISSCKKAGSLEEAIANSI